MLNKRNLGVGVVSRLGHKGAPTVLSLIKQRSHERKLFFILRRHMGLRENVFKHSGT